MIELRQLRSLIAVAEQKSFSAAADILHTVQSNVSAHVARLEQELGVILIDRKDYRLTSEGQAVVDRAYRIEAELEAIHSDVAALSNEVIGTVRLGMIGTTARWLLPKLLDLSKKLYPKLDLIGVEGTSSVLETQLESGRLDLAVIPIPVGGDFYFQNLFQEELVLVVKKDHPLASKEKVDLSDIANIELLLPVQGTTFRKELDSAIAPAKIKLHPIAELEGVRLIASLTFDEYGPSILPATAVLPSWVNTLTAVPVQGLYPRCVVLAQRKMTKISSPSKAISDLIHTAVEEQAKKTSGLHSMNTDSHPKTKASK